MTSTPKTIAAALVATLVAGASSAQPLTLAETPPGEWSFQFTPYIFLPNSATGTSVVDGIEGDLDLNLSDILDLLQGAASFQFEAWNGDWGVIADGYYSYLNYNERLSLPGPAGGTIDVDADARQAWLSIMGAYRFAKGTTAAGLPYAFDASAGLKWNLIEQTVDVDVNVPIGGGLRKGQQLGGTESWWEPTFGLRGAVGIAERWTLEASGEVGGFGVNGSEFQYLARIGADWQATETMSLNFGWQFQGIDFSTGSGRDEFTYDVDQNGLFLAASFRF